MLVVIWKKYDDLVSYSEMFSIILKVIFLFQITKGIYLLNVLNIMPIYGIGNLHISRIELHIDISVEPLFFSLLIAFVPSKYTNRVLDMSIPLSLWQYFFNFIYNHFGFCGRDWLQRQKIKTK